MREIKFRGKRAADGRWAHGYYLPWHAVKDTQGNEIYAQIFEEYQKNRCFVAKGWCMVVPSTVGQYTGLKDKNGVEIYEGDILFGFKKEVVAFSDGAFCKKDKKENVWHRMNGRDMGGYEVIGNIYDNPELLKEEVEE